MVLNAVLLSPTLIELLTGSAAQNIVRYWPVNLGREANVVMDMGYTTHFTTQAS